MRAEFSGAAAMRAIIGMAVLSVHHVAMAGVTLRVDLSRKTYWRGETIHAEVACKNDAAKTFPTSILKAACGPLISETAVVPAITGRATVMVRMTLSTRPVRSGEEYPLTFQLLSDGASKPVAEVATRISVVRKPNPQQLDVWQWAYGGPIDVVDGKSGTRARELGFTVAGGPFFPYSPPNADPRRQLKLLRPSLETAMKRGMDVSICPVGIWRREYKLIQPRGVMPLVAPKAANGGKSKTTATPSVHPDDDIRYQGAARNGHEYFNPFHPEVARRQNRANELMMQMLGDFPNVKYAFVDAEWVDDLYYHNANAGGLALMKRTLGFTRQEIGPPKFVAPGVLANDDRGLLYRRYVYQHGNGVNLALKRAADAVHRHRPDVKFLSDPYRSAALLDMFPGCDMISTWTYTNPDPKLMLYIETLRAVCRPAGQEPLHVVTLLNYPGEVVPESHDKNWMMMGPGRLIETTWINLSRAPKVIGYFSFDAYDTSDLAFSPATISALTTLSQKVFIPYGPLLRNLDVAPRRIAVLSSDSSRLYNKSPHLLGYPNYQAYHFYTVMAMSHLNADVVFDETIERYGLDGYDVLALPKCDVLTKTVYDRILRFQKRGGVVLADQYLGPEIPGVLRFDFGFTHRRKVNANAIATGKIYVGAGQDDHIVPGKSAMKKVQGVTARQDQLILESYAARLRKELAGKVEPNIWCDQHDVLLNTLEKRGVKYLVLINDKRDYDDRTGPFKAVMEKLVPRTVTVRLRRAEFAQGTIPYDLLAKQALVATEKDGIVSFSVKLNEIGGTIVALAPRSIRGVRLEAPRWIRRNTAHRLRVQVVDSGGGAARGLHPLRIRIRDPAEKETEYTHHACTDDGRYEFTFAPALNDPPGRWTIAIDDLTAGFSAVHEVDILNE